MRILISLILIITTQLISAQNHTAIGQKIASGNGHSLLIKSDATLWAWGDNTDGQLGDGTNLLKLYPVQIGSESKWTVVATGYSHSAGIKADGTLWTWGSNSSGQLGDGTTNNRLVPTKVGNDNKWTKVVAGFAHTIALKSDGTMWAWGGNSFGQLGINSTVQQLNPIKIGSLNNWTSISAGWYNSAAISSNGSLWTWGENSDGAIGDGSLTNRLIPTRVGLEYNWKQVSTGFSTLAIKYNGTLWAWGANNSGQLGDGSTVRKIVPSQVGTDNQWVYVNSSGHTLAVKNNGTLWSWGFNNYGQLGNGNTTGSSVPLQVGSDNSWLMACGFNQSIGIKTNGQILTWGSNSYGQLGNGSLVNSFSPGQITNRGDKPYQISSGLLNNLIIKSNGSLWGWGSNSSGELGEGSQVDKLIPTQVGTETNWRNVKTYTAMSVGIKQDGTLWAWGNNQNQALGSGSSTPMYQTTPLLISNDGKWMDIASSQNGFCSMMIKADGTLWGWGLNQYGELGNGTTTQLFTPTQIGTDTWKAVSIGATHSLGIKSNGTLWAWGMGGSGELGTGIDYAQSLEPIQVGTSGGWVAIQAGQGYSIALTVNGILWTWGNGWYGTLGNGSHTNVNIPTFISLDGYWKNINTAGSFVTALKSNGQLWGWGANNSFQLTNPPGPTNIPIQLSPDEDWINTGAGSSFTTALHSNGIICAVGSNNNGELGNGSVVPSQTFDCQVGTVLPVSYLHHQSQWQSKNAYLHWVTEGEVDTKNFTVERSIDGNSFSSIGTVIANNRPGVHNYSFIDVHVANTNQPALYYRIKQLDIDGRFRYSNISKLTKSFDAANLIVYPNPAKEILKISLDQPAAVKNNYKITDMSGRILLQGTLTQLGQQYSIPVASLKPGYYVVQIITNGQQQLAKFIKK